MKRALLVIGAALAAGCSHTSMSLDSSTGGAGSSVQIHVESGGDLLTLIGLGIVAAGMIEMERIREQDRYRSGPVPFAVRDIPPLAADRVVTEHDCTQPIESFSGNLRCR
jgi:hypothetical protein